MKTFRYHATVVKSEKENMLDASLVELPEITASGETWKDVIESLRVKTKEFVTKNKDNQGVVVPNSGLWQPSTYVVQVLV